MAIKNLFVSAEVETLSSNIANLCGNIESIEKRFDTHINGALSN